MAADGMDHINDIERELIDNLRTGTFNGSGGSTTAWDSSDVTVFGQFPDTADVQYPAIIVEHIANGLETQFMGQDMGAQKGEIYGVGFNILIGVDKDSSITVNGPYKERRLINYIMLNCANILMDTDFSSLTDTQVLERHYAGFREIQYLPDLEIWTARTNMIITFKNTR